MIKYNVPNIGQGCCVEQLIYQNLERHRVLYDCGSNNLSLLRKYIDTLDPSIPTTLVLSHLHHDHINGIPHLLKHFAKHKIKKLFLPAYYPEFFNLFALGIIGRDADETTPEETRELVDFIINLRGGDGGSPSIAEVVYVDPRKDNLSRHRNRIIHTKPKKIIKSANENAYWAIKFWVDRDIYSLFADEDLDELKNIKPYEFIDKKEDAKNKYQDAVKKAKVNFNQTSMLMVTYLSGLSNIAQVLLYVNPLPHYRVLSFYNNGFVCTGDYPFSDRGKGKSIQRHYSEENIQIRQMMVPHHGGKDYCDYIPFDFIERAYAQNKEKRYGHPDQTVVDFVKSLGIEFINNQVKL